MANDEPHKSLLDRIILWAPNVVPVIALAALGVNQLDWKWGLPAFIFLLLLTLGVRTALRRVDQTQLESQARLREAERGLEEALRGPVVVVDSVDHGDSRVP